MGTRDESALLDYACHLLQELVDNSAKMCTIAKHDLCESQIELLQQKQAALIEQLEAEARRLVAAEGEQLFDPARPAGKRVAELLEQFALLNQQYMAELRAIYEIIRFSPPS